MKILIFKRPNGDTDSILENGVETYAQMRARLPQDVSDIKETTDGPHKDFLPTSDPSIAAREALSHALANVAYQAQNGKIQARKQDKDDLEAKIAELPAGGTNRWLFQDNSSGVVTKEELVAALAYGIAQRDALFEAYFDSAGV